jgi:ribosomal protein S14
MRKSLPKIYKNIKHYNINENINLLNKIILLKRTNNIYKIKTNSLRKKTICLESNNTRSVYTDFALTRMNIKENMNLGHINGLKKSS